MLGEDVVVSVKLGGYVVSGYVLSKTFAAFYEAVGKHYEEGKV